MVHQLLAMAAVSFQAGGEPKPIVPTPPSVAVDLVGALETALTETIARVESSVVAIAREKVGRSEETLAVRGHESQPPFIPLGRAQGLPDLNNLGFNDIEPAEYIASDYGSGVVIGPNNEILTAFSVVQGASRLVVRAKGAGYFEAEVIAADPRTDLAVIVPRADPRADPRVKPPALRPIPLGDSTKLRKGSFLLALGNPFNSARDGLASASWGILANNSRRLDSLHLRQEPSKKQLRHYPTLLQLDSKLNLGMSGGAVVNLRGELVGVTTDAANVGGFDAQAGYAIPLDAIGRRAIEALRQGREVEYGFLGIVIPEDNSNKVDRVSPGTPAGEGGLRGEDQILSIGSIPVADADGLIMAVNTFAPGMVLPVHIRREGKELDKTITVSKLPIRGEVIATNRRSPWRGLRIDFLSTSPRTAEFIAQNHGGFEGIDAMAHGGVLIAEVRPGSPVDDAELHPGQIIIAVDGTPVRSPDDFTRVVGTKKGPVTLTVEGNRQVVIKDAPIPR